MGVDRRAASGFATVADAYERGRPSYPSELIDRVAGYFDLSGSSSVLDLAAGTGQLSRLLHRRVGQTIAVEPMPMMRAKIAAELPDVSVLDGTAESIPLDAGTLDAVVVGEAFHWFSTAAATAEIARVPTEIGGVALLWNTPTWTTETTPWLDDFRRIVAHHKDAAGSYPAGAASWQAPFEHTGLFDALTHVQARHAQTLEPVDFLAQVASWSWIANLEPDQRQLVLDDVGTVVRDLDDIVISYRTDLYMARRRRRDSAAACERRPGRRSPSGHGDARPEVAPGGGAAGLVGAAVPVHDENGGVVEEVPAGGVHHGAGEGLRRLGGVQVDDVGQQVRDVRSGARGGPPPGRFAYVHVR